MSTYIITTRAHGFAPRQGLKWTALTEVESVKTLVRDREQLFVKHRQLANPILETKSFEKLTEIFNSKNDNIIVACFDRYLEFSSMVNIPPFPLSLSTMTLFLFAKVSFQNGHYKTNFCQLCEIRRKTIDLWTGIIGYADLEDEQAVEQGLNEFMAERTLVRVKAGRKPPHVSTSQNATTSSYNVPPAAKKIKLQHPPLTRPVSQIQNPQYFSPAGYSPSTSSQPSPSLPHRTMNHTSSPPLPVPPLSGPTSNEFYPVLGSLLKGLHPSLSLLTSSLLTAGIDSLEKLVLFCSCEGATVKKFLKALQDEARISRETISVVHLKLLQKKLEEAKNEDWSVEKVTA